MSFLNKVAKWPEFAAEKPETVERELAELLEGGSKGKIEHVWEEVRKRIAKLVSVTANSFEQRESEAEAVAAGFVSGIPVVLLGPPGTAKSALVRRFASLCGLVSGEQKVDDKNRDSKARAGYFEYLVTNHTMPEELFGGLDLDALKAGKIVRVIDGKLPSAEIVFLDEVFRGRSHILNTLLTIINEKRYDSGSGAMHVPLLGIVGASNRAPTEQDLEAFFDRFPIRVWVRSVLDQEWSGATPSLHLHGPQSDAAGKVVSHSVTAETRRLRQAWNQEAAARVRMDERESCTNDFRFARFYLLHKLAGGDYKNSERFHQFERLFRAVRSVGLLSDRSLGQLWLFAAALDLLRGKDPLRPFKEMDVDPDGHLRVFQYVARTDRDVPWLMDQVALYTKGVQHTGDR